MAGFAWEAGRDMNALSGGAGGAAGPSGAYSDAFTDFGDVTFEGGNLNHSNNTSTFILVGGLLIAGYIFFVKNK